MLNVKRFFKKRYCHSKDHPEGMTLIRIVVYSTLVSIPLVGGYLFVHGLPRMTLIEVIGLFVYSILCCVFLFIYVMPKDSSSTNNQES